MKFKLKASKTLTSLALMGALALTGCTAANTTASSSGSAFSSSSTTAASTASSASSISYDTHHSDGDLTWDASSEVSIDLSNPSASSGVTVENGVITISAEGNYRLTGSYSGQVKIAAADTDKVRIILDGASIENSSGPAFMAESADEVIIYTASGTNNSISDGSSYSATGSQDPDAALFARTDLTLAGQGSLTVTGKYADGIASRDGLVIAGGSITVEATGHGIKGKDYVDILDGTISVTAGSEGDGIKSTNDTDAERGWVRLSGGSVTISAGDDGFKAERELEITGGSLTITKSVEGIEAQHLMISGGQVELTSSDDGINATVPSTESTTNTSSGFGGGMDQAVDATISISGGSSILHVEGDGIDSNGSATISGGTVVVDGPSSGGNGATDATGGLTVTGGTLIQGDSGDMFEGMEGAYARFSASVSAGQTVTVTNSAGETVAEYSFTKRISAIVVAGDGVEEGQTYTLSIKGAESATATASSGAAAMGMGGGMGQPPAGGRA